MKLLGAILISVLMQIIVVQVPFFNEFFKTVPLSLMDWAYVVLVSSSVFVIIEIYKFLIVKIKPDLAR
jgi:Ca2+-transporting ATPase